jgi:hypothetical protein
VAGAGALGRQTITPLQASGDSEVGSKAGNVTPPASAAAKPVLIVEIASMHDYRQWLIIFEYSVYSGPSALSG